MTISAKILAHSLNAHNNIELYTFELVLPRLILAEFNTYRMLSRNASSSRAIPAAKMRERIKANPFYFTKWGKHQKGMGADEVLDPEKEAQCRTAWKHALDTMLSFHEQLEQVGLAKECTNRLLEPWMYTTVVATGNEEAWLHLLFERDHKKAQPEFQVLAKEIRKAMEEAHKPSNIPRVLHEGQWHLPYIDFDDFLVSNNPLIPGDSEKDDFWAKISSARCARTSYLTQDGKRDLSEDLRLFRDLVIRENNPEDPIHASPLEHACMCVDTPIYIGNVKGFRQYRKFFKNENTFAKLHEEQ